MKKGRFSNKPIAENKRVAKRTLKESYDDLDYAWDSIEEEITNEVRKVFPDFDGGVYFDDSRAWSLYINGYDVGLPVNKFGAYRNYAGGGVRGGIQHNGRVEDGTVELGKFFAKKLAEIEDIINSGYEDEPEWDQPTGVLLRNESKDKCTDKGCGKTIKKTFKSLKESYGNVNATKLANFIKNAVEGLKKEGDGTWYFHLVDNLYYVIGGVNPANYDIEDLENFATDENGWVICGKIAVNVDDLQSDYEMDWYMPFEQDGETWNTERELYNDEDYNSVAQDVINELQGFEGVVVSDNGEISPEYDRRAVEQEYDLEDGELDGVSIRDAEDMIGTEEGELDRFIIQREGCKKGKGKKKLKEKKSCKPKRNLKEKVSDEAYQVADIINDRFDGEGYISMDDFDEAFALAIRQVFGIDNVWDNVETVLPNGDDVRDFEIDVRGILSYEGWETSFEGDDEGSLTQVNVEQPSENKIIYDALVAYEKTNWDSIGKLEQKVLNDLISKYESKVDMGEGCKPKKKAKKVEERKACKPKKKLKEESFEVKDLKADGKGYYSCREGENLWSYREDTEEQLVLTLADDKTKTYKLVNSGYVDRKLQKDAENQLIKKGYKKGKVRDI